MRFLNRHERKVDVSEVALDGQPIEIGVVGAQFRVQRQVGWKAGRERAVRSDHFQERKRSGKG